MADLVLVHSPDPAALLAHVARPFCVPGRTASPLPLVAVRQGGVRDTLLDRAARAGCAGWLGAPVVIFRELPEVLAGPLAPLTVFERHALLVRALGAAGRGALGAAGDGRGRPGRSVLRMLDALVGDLRAQRVTPADAAAAFAALHPTGDEEEDAWARLRDAEVAGVYAAYVAELEALPPLGGRARSDGRDATACAAEAVAADPDAVGARLRVPFGPAGAPRTVCLHGLNDLRGGWGRLVGALHAAAFVDELRVSMLTDDGPAAAARHAAALASDDPWAAAADGAEPTGEDALAHALLAQSLALGAPARIERAAPDAQRDPPRDAECGARPAALAHVQATLFGALPARLPAPPQGDAPAAVRAVAAPDVAREADLVARRVKRLLVEGDGAGPVAPHRVLVVSRQARPYGERVVEALRRHGVPVTARLRVALPRVGAVGAFLRLGSV